MKFHLKKLNLDQQGVAKVLGALEADVMEVVWANSDATVREVCEHLKSKKAYSFNTIMTVMNRLVEKGVLKKKERKGSFVYVAKKDRASFLEEVNKSVFMSLVKDGDLFQLSAFVDALSEYSEKDLEKLKKIIDGKL